MAAGDLCIAIHDKCVCCKNTAGEIDSPALGCRIVILENRSCSQVKGASRDIDKGAVGRIANLMGRFVSIDDDILKRQGAAADPEEVAEI